MLPKPMEQPTVARINMGLFAHLSLVVLISSFGPCFFGAAAGAAAGAVAAAGVVSDIYFLKNKIIILFINYDGKL